MEEHLSEHGDGGAAAGAVTGGGETPPASPGVLDLMYGALFSPVATFRAAAARPHLGRAAVVLAVVSAVGAVVGLVGAGRQLGAGADQAAAVPAGALAGPLGFAWLVTPFAFWYLESGVFYVTGTLLGGRGEVVSLMAVLAVASMPQVFTAPVALLGAAVRGGLGFWLSFALGVWVVVLDILGIREALHLSTGRAAATFFLPLAAVVVLVVLLALGFIAALLPLIRQLSPAGGIPLP